MSCVRACECACVHDIIQMNIENEFKQHSKESRGVLGQASKQAGKQASKQAGRQARRELKRKLKRKLKIELTERAHRESKQAGRQAGKQASKEAGKHVECIQSEPCPGGACLAPKSTQVKILHFKKKLCRSMKRAPRLLHM